MCKLYNHYHNKNTEHFYYFKKFPLCCCAVISLPLPQTWIPADLCSQTHVASESGFLHEHALAVPPHQAAALLIAPQRGVRGVDVPRFICPFTSGGHLGCFQFLVIMNKAAVHLCTGLCVGMFSFLMGKRPWV